MFDTDTFLEKHIMFQSKIIFQIIQNKWTSIEFKLSTATFTCMIKDVLKIKAVLLNVM